jgi:exopolysaccharide production protein ExoY
MRYVSAEKIAGAADPGIQQPLGGWLKRAVDISIASVVVVLLLPLIVLIGLTIKLSMGGPVIYAHRRVGHNGAPFNCYKFRTMAVNSDELLRKYLASDPDAAQEWLSTRKLRNDPRVTALGNALRRSSLDELPQLLNVLRGEMSCVGPRPIVAEELEIYGRHAKEYLRARPGMTGAWQVSGRSDTTYQERVALDCAYVSNWSVWLDLLILLKTIPAAIGSRGSC